MPLHGMPSHTMLRYDLPYTTCHTTAQNNSTPQCSKPSQGQYCCHCSCTYSILIVTNKTYHTTIVLIIYMHIRFNIVMHLQSSAASAATTKGNPTPPTIKVPITTSAAKQKKASTVANTSGDRCCYCQQQTKTRHETACHFTPLHSKVRQVNPRHRIPGYGTTMPLHSPSNHATPSYSTTTPHQDLQDMT